MGTQLPSPEKGHSPQFAAHVYCGQTTGWNKIPLSTEVGLGQEHIVLDGYPAPHLKWETASHFSAHVYCGQAARWIKMALGMELGLGPASYPQKRGHTQSHSIFGPCSLW